MRSIRMAAVVLAAIAVATPALALDETEANIHAIPGSLLIFPLFDANENHGTYITVTNTNASGFSCLGRYVEGDICAHFTYINHDPTDEECLEFDRYECLTPGDTITVDTAIHNPEHQQGWLWVEALDPGFLEPITFNHLIGSAIIVEADTDFAWSYTPYTFQSLVEADCNRTIACQTILRCVTDENTNGFADFDGVEYPRFPDKVLIPLYFKEGEKRIENELTLMSVETDQSTPIAMRIFDDSETIFSRGTGFQCFLRGPLSDLASIVELINGPDPERFETGWISIDGGEGVLGVFRHERTTGQKTFTAGNELYVEGKETEPVKIRRFGR